MTDLSCDVAIAGGGVNALACGAVLARSGLSVLIAESNDIVGGGSITRELTLPGFKHDCFGSYHSWIHANPDLKPILPELERFGLKYIWATNSVAGHPDINGPGLVLYRDINKTVESIARYSRKDAARYRQICDEFESIREGFVKGYFSPPAAPSMRAQALETTPTGLQRLRDFSLSAHAWVEENYQSDFVRAVMLSWGLVSQTFPDQEFGGQTFYVMGPALHAYGHAVPQGGTQGLPDALASYICSKGGTVLTRARVESFSIEREMAVGFVLADGRSVRAKRAVVSALDPKQTFLRRIDPASLSAEFVERVRNYSFGRISICRMHLALREQPRFCNDADMSTVAVHRVVDSTAQILRQFQDIAAGLPPMDPFLWVGCWTLADPTRAPPGHHTLMFDTYVPNCRADGKTWDETGLEYARNVLLPKLRQYAPNLTDDVILGSHVDTRDSLERANPSFVDGTTTGGEYVQAQVGAFRPFPGYAHYRSPVRNLYMAGPHCHPGAGISGMGTITANVLLADQRNAKKHS